MNKMVAVSAAAIGLAAAGWAGGSLLAAQKAEAAIVALKNAPTGPGAALRVTRLEHARGFFSSQGQADVRFEPGCSASEGADEGMSFRVDYRMSHLLLPGSVTRFEWQATPAGPAAEGFKTLFGSVTSLAGQGTVGLGGALRTDMSLPELSVRRAGEALQVSPSTGFFGVNGPALAFGWKVGRIVVRGGGQAVDAKDISIEVDLLNRHLGTGSIRLGAEQVSTSAGSLEGVALRSEAKEREDRIDFTLSPSIRSLKASGVDLSDLSLELALKGLDTRSVETLSKVFEASCGMQALTAEEGRKASDAFTRIFSRGMSVGIPSIKGRSADGSVSGELVVELAPAPGGKPSLAAQLKSSGRLEATGSLLPAAQRDLAVKLGLAIPQGKGLVASFSYAEGVLKVNDRVHDAAGFLDALQMADQQMQEMVADWSQAAPDTPARRVEPPPAQTQAVAAAASPAPNPEPAPAAPAPAPPSAAPGCSAIAACVQQTLAAGRKSDIEEVRRLAALIEALPKPDPGNRPVSRQLNAAGIEALRREEFGLAVAKLREAQGENPRDVEIVANLGFALVGAGQPAEAVTVLQAALALDPRRTSTWTPLAEAYALAGRMDDARAALWIGFQWSANRDKSLTYYQERATRETRAPLQALYGQMAVVARQQLGQGS